MAKNIKVLKCPNCGSVDKREVKLDFYKCTSCQTEYFLDDNDININHNHTYNYEKQSASGNVTPIKIVSIIIGSIFVLLSFLFIVSSIFGDTEPKNDYIYSTSTPSKQEENKEDNEFYTNRQWSSTFIHPSNQQPIVVMLESRRYRANISEQKNGTYVAFYNLIKREQLAEQKVSNKSLTSSDFEFRTFSDDNIYMINNEATLLKLDKVNLEIKEVGQIFFEANNELEIGIATIEFLPEGAGDGLVLMTNDGKKRYYYPFIHKLYTEEEYYKANQGFNSLLPDAKERTYYVFTSKSRDYPEEKLQLIKIIYKDNGAGPKYVKGGLSWWRDFGGTGIFTENDPSKKVLLNRWNKEKGRILSWKDITPDRLYFDPSVLIDNSEALIIQFRVNANPKSGFKFQHLDRENGNVLWTSTLNEGKEIEYLIEYKDGFVAIDSDDSITVLDKKGNTIDQYKLD